MKYCYTFCLCIFISSNAFAQYEKVYEYLNSANTKHGEADYEGAILDYNKVIELDKGNIKAYFNRATSHANLGHTKEAIDDYSKAIELNPKYIKAYDNRAHLKYKLEWFKQAIEDFGMVIELSPNYKVAYFNRALAYLYIDNKTSACADLYKANELGYSKAQGKIDRFCKGK